MSDANRETLTPSQESVIEAVALMQQGKSDAAKELLEALSVQNPVVFEVWYLLAFIHYGNGNFDRTLDAGERCLQALENEDAPAAVTDLRERLHELCMTLGNSAIGLDRREEAIAWFQRGLTYDDTHGPLYQNIGTLLIQQGSMAEAHTILAAGREKSPDDAETWRMLGLVHDELHAYGAAEEALEQAIAKGSVDALFDAATHFLLLARPHRAKEYIERYCAAQPDEVEGANLRSRIAADPKLREPGDPTLTVAMIVKNEEELLEQCLTSIQDLHDELVIVDTGSDDRTVEIAESFGAKVFHHPWNNSFSEARNHSIDHASGDWILYIDADEELLREDIPVIRRLLWERKLDAVNVGVYSLLPGQLGDAARGKHYYPRLFRRDPDMRFTGIVHNLLVLEGKKVGMSEVRIMHYGYDLDKEKMDQKFERSLKLLLQQVAETPDDPFVRYNTAQMYLSRHHAEKARPHAEHVLSILGPEQVNQRHLFLMAHYQLALVYYRTGNMEEAERYCREALQYKPDYIDPMLALGVILVTRKQYREGEELLIRFLKERERLVTAGDYNLLILNKLGADFEALYFLGLAAFEQEELQKATEYLYQSMEVNQYHWLTYALLGKIAVQQKDYDVAVEAFETGIKCGYLNAQAYRDLGAEFGHFREMLSAYQSVLMLQAEQSGSRKGLEDALHAVDAYLDGES